jgi:hypothetical protein
MISILAKMQLYSLITSADLSFIPSIVEELRQVPCPTLSLSMARYLRETIRHVIEQDRPTSNTSQS